MLEKHTLLQINATIVAGLLILLTISAISSESILDLKIKSNLLNKELQILLNDYPKIKENIEITEGRQNITSVPNPEGGIMFTIPFPPPYLYAQDKAIEEIFQENYRERVKLSAAIAAYEQLNNFEFLLANPVMLVSIMIIPFLSSMIIEVKNWLLNKDHISNASIVAFIIGIIVMISIFGAGTISTYLI